jgi:hypothetical protein
MTRTVITTLPIISVVTLVTFLIPSPVLTQTAALATVNTNSTDSFLLSKAYVKGNIAYFIATDASNNQTAASIAENLGYKVNYAPRLALVPESAQQQGYEFLNGIKGEGAFGFQIPVASALPGDKGYSPIVQLNFVSWNENATAIELKSEEEILNVQNNSELDVTRTNILINSPGIQLQ